MDEKEDSKIEPEIVQSIAFRAGAEASKSGIPILKSALKNLNPYSQQFADFIAGYDSIKECKKARQS